MRIEKLYDTTKGETVFIAGTGPSMRVFPKDFLRDKFVIGLNQFWRYLVPNYTLTIHPELYLEWEVERKANPAIPKHLWVIKKKPPMAQLETSDPNHYVFHTGKLGDLNVVKTQPADTLYLGEGIQCTAIDLAVRMGAKNIVLVGCDMASLGGDFHGHDQHVRWLGQTPDKQYGLYREHTARIRSYVWDKFGVGVMTLSPFVGVANPGEDYERMRKERGLPPLPVPKDTSPYRRE